MTKSPKTHSSSAAAAAASPFVGFADDVLAFYRGLEADNSKTYWADHLQIYEQAVRAPMHALLAELEAEFGSAKFFRPYRDVRFSADKSPYKTHAAAVLHHDDGAGSLYVQVSADGLLVAGGYYHMSRDQLARYRATLDEHESGQRLATVVDALSADGFTLGGERLARAPRGTDPAHPYVELLRHKGLAAFLDLGSPEWLDSPRCLAEIAGAWRRLAPLNAWLASKVGPAEPVAGDGGVPRRGRAVSGRGSGV